MEHGFGLVLGDVGEVVEDQQVVLVEPGDGSFERKFAPSDLQALDERGGSVCLHTFRGVSKWLRRPCQAAAGIGVAMLMYAWSGVFPPCEEWGLLPL